jgi:hypothetical protein
MSLLLKVVAEVIGPMMASFELRPCDLAEQDSLRPESSQEHPPGSIGGVPSATLRTSSSTPRIKPFVMRQICEALRSHGAPGQAG